MSIISVNGKSALTSVSAQWLLAAALLGFVSGASAADAKPPYDLDSVLKEREAAYAAWAKTHTVTPASIATLKQQTSELVKQAGDAALPARRNADSKPLVWRVNGAITEIWDRSDVPPLVVIPAGAFVMGSPNDPNRDKEPMRAGSANAAPAAATAPAVSPPTAASAVVSDRHPVTITQAFALGKYPVTRAEFAHFVVDTGYQTNGACSVRNGENWTTDATKGWRDPGFEQGPSDPVVCVSWNDAIAYIAWLSGKTGNMYRLPSAAEYEYAAAGGTSGTTFWFGSKADHDFMNFGSDDLCAGGACTPLIKGNDKWAYTSPVGSFKANPFGVYDMNGNIRQWVMDCDSQYPVGSPTDGKPDTADCSKRRQRSGSWNSIPAHSFQSGNHTESPDYRSSSLGFRVVRTL